MSVLEATNTVSSIISELGLSVKAPLSYVGAEKSLHICVVEFKILRTVSGPPFEGLSLILESITLLIGLSVSDKEDPGFYLKTSQDHNCAEAAVVWDLSGPGVDSVLHCSRLGLNLVSITQSLGLVFVAIRSGGK